MIFIAEKVEDVAHLAKIPTKAHYGDMGFDLYSVEDVVIRPPDSTTYTSYSDGTHWRDSVFNFTKVRTGIKMEFSDGWGAKIFDRSSMASKGIVTAAGVIDSGYRGEILVVMYNFSNDEYKINVGDKIAQLIPMQIHPVAIMEGYVGTMSSERGAHGFGSSGR